MSAKFYEIDRVNMERMIVNNVSKKFRIGSAKKERALARFVYFFSGRESKRNLWVMKDISFRVQAKEIVGIIGENGSGKSTLLRIVAEIYDRNSGTIEIKGKIIPLINLKIGMKPLLSMKDNIYVIASLFGLPRKEIKKRFSAMIEFSELGDFVNTKIYQFSRGMLQRLTFSVAVHCRPEVLLLDEIFEVGDEKFRIKSAGKIKELADNGAAVLIVSHNLDLVARYCDRVIWVERGRIKQQGRPKGIINDYLVKMNDVSQT
ncbi:MAG: ABC transporter ATP-binding protein [bacterium]